MKLQYLTNVMLASSVLASFAVAPVAAKAETVRLAQHSSSIYPQSLDNDLPRPIAIAVIEDLSERTRQPVKNFRIIQAESHAWSDSCLGLSQPGTSCAQRIVPGWQVLVTNGSQNWIYRTNASGNLIRLASVPTLPSQIGSNINFSEEDRQRQQGWDTVLELGRLEETDTDRSALVAQLAILDKPVTTYANAVYQVEARRNGRWIPVYTNTGARLIPNSSGRVILPPEVIPVERLNLRRLNSNVNLEDLDLRTIVRIRYDLPSGSRDLKLQLEKTEEFDDIAQTSSPQLISTRGGYIQ
ncbi:hypothetical protein WA1_00670 [Scytonema hofmannii PCC 7110]|uniref:Uncharacterized protein n=1 Tax=Scytonema hofmannii PCC 7110 TaxID=128403 RepID=A0A139XG88_9CYAN|nr:hypothetical protein [Scytonema hofmannii]KYC43714.1 hypothetical protein WA1_00670 [Scytonema hofmannii PCC 7110]